MSSYEKGNATPIPLRDFAPSADPLSAGILLDARSALPTLRGFEARKAPALYTADPLPAAFNGGILAYYTTGEVSVIAGTATNLYRLGINGGWTSIGSNFAATSRWRFFQFGDDVIAMAAGASTQVAAGVSGSFAALAGSPPSDGRTGLSVGGIPMIFESANWHSGAAGVDDSWVPNIQTQAGRAQLYDYPGNITAAAPIFRNVVVAKASAMWMGEYIGGSAIWNFQPIADAVGVPNPEAMIPLTDCVVFRGNNDFYQTGGYTPQPIPNNLNKWFIATRDPAYDIQGWWDVANSIAWWHFVSTSAPVIGKPDLAVGWHQPSGKWTVEHLNVNGILVPNTQAPLTTGLYFDTNNYLRTWNGTPTTMQLTTGYLGDPSKFTQLMRMRWQYATRPTSQSMKNYHAPYIGADLVETTPDAVLGNDDWFNLREYDRVHTARIQTVGPCEVTSYAFEARIGGVR